MTEKKEITDQAAKKLIEEKQMKEQQQEIVNVFQTNSMNRLTPELSNGMITHLFKIIYGETDD